MAWILFFLGLLVLGFTIYKITNLSKKRSFDITYPSCQLLNLTFPKHYNQIFKVASESKPGFMYNVNPYKITCDCPDFKTHGRHQRKGSIERICKHLAQVMIEEGHANHSPLEPLLRERREAKCFYHPSKKIIFGFTPGRAWIDVYAQSGANAEGEPEYSGFMYDLSQRSWASSGPPQDEQDILRMIRKTFG